MENFTTFEQNQELNTTKLYKGDDVIILCLDDNHTLMIGDNTIQFYRKGDYMKSYDFRGVKIGDRYDQD